MRIIYSLFLVFLCGCSRQSTDDNRQVVAIEKFGVTHSMTAPKTVIVGDEYGIAHTIDFGQEK
jgi:hypothetical protein